MFRSCLRGILLIALTLISSSIQVYGFSVNLEKEFIVFKVDIVNVSLPNATTSFTTISPENVIHLQADIKPDSLDTYNSNIEWIINGTGTPTQPSNGNDVSLTISVPPIPAAPNGRGYPLSFDIKAKLKIDTAEYTSDITTIHQDEIDQCRQEYIDMNKATKPTRAQFVNAMTYQNPGHFSFNEINSGSYSWAIFSIANNLENIRTDIGNMTMTVNSGYRNPIHNANIGGKPESRHIYGLAADIAVIDYNGDGNVNKTDWDILATAAQQADAWVEPYTDTGYWVHMDWGH